MPKPNQTMLDKLAETFKSMGKPAPFREMKLHGESTDPMFNARANQVMSIPKGITLDPSWPVPERVKYQKGIEARMQPKYLKADEDVGNAYNEMDAYKDEWSSAVDDAKEYMKEDWETGLDDQAFEDVDPDYMEVDAPSTNLRDYWPNDARTPDEIYSDFDAAQDRYYAAKDVQRDLRRPEAWMQEQTMTPRYRNYQRAMRQREDNARVGRLNAAIMNLYRRGYSMPEIREILRNQRIR